MILEVIVQSVADAVAATDGGADRLEVVRRIDDGGLKPALSLVRAIAAEVSLPLRVMVRENAGYETTAAERAHLRTAVSALAALEVDGIVLGFARDGRPALDDVVSVLEGAPSVRVTFHRAFDALRDPLSAIDEIAGVPAIDRILTSGGDGSASARAQRLRDYATRAGARLGIIAGGGVDEAALAVFAGSGWVSEIHVGRAARADNRADGPVVAARVRRLRALLDARASPPATPD